MTYALTNASPLIRPSEVEQEPTVTAVTSEASEAAPAQATQEAPEAAEREAQIQRLLSKISQNPDFPSLRDSIQKIQKLARCETAHLRSFTEEIIKDVALSNKMLRLINTAFYRSSGGGTIDSLSRAISLMGFQSVGMLAASLKLFDNLPKNDSAQRVQQEFSRALMASLMANELCPSRKLAESTYLTAMFQNLGRMLVWMHFPTKAAQIESMSRHDMARVDPEEFARLGRHALQIRFDNRNAKAVLYLTLDDLSSKVARMWGWPENLQSALKPYLPEDREREIGRDEYVRITCSLSNSLASVLAETPADEHEAEFGRFQQRWSNVYGENPEEFKRMLKRVDTQWSQMAQVMNLAKLHPLMAKNLAKVQSAIHRGEDLPSPFMLTAILQQPAKCTAAQLASTAPPIKTPAKAVTPEVQPVQEAQGAVKQASKLASTTRPTQNPPARNTKPPTPNAQPVVANQAISAEESQAHLSHGIEELSNLVVSDASLGEVLLLTIKIVRESLNAQRVIVCLRDKRTHTLVGRVGVGESGQAMANWFKIPVNPSSDLFGLLCAKGADTLISDSSGTTIVSRLPEWYTTHVNAPTFLVLPLNMGVSTNGMIYADHATPDSLAIDDQVLKRLKTLRNQLVMAIHMQGLD